MADDNELSLDERIERLRPELRTRVRLAWAPYGAPDKRISNTTADEYVEDAKAAAHETWESTKLDDAELLELLAAHIDALVRYDEAEIARIIDECDWTRTTKIGIAVSAKRHGSAIDQFGNCVGTLWADAIELVIERRRHFPWRRLSLKTFLIRTVDSLYSHAWWAAKREGERLSLVNEVSDSPAPDEYSANALSARDLNREEELLLEVKYREFIRSLRDPELEEYVRARVVEPGATAKELARFLNCTETKIRTMHRRLLRRFAQWGRPAVVAPPKKKSRSDGKFVSPDGRSRL